MTTETMPTTAPVETVTPIKPSEAIRLGCLIAPVQVRGDFGNRRKQIACALGAMNIGYGRRTNITTNASMSEVEQRARRLNISWDGCPADRCRETHGPLVVHLNDDHRWSRERIADWLAEQGL